MIAQTMQGEIERLLRPLSRADIFTRPASSVISGALRLEAGFYGSQGYRALQSMENSGFDLSTLGSAAKVKWPGIFSRVYVEDPSAGVPFLSSSTMLTARLAPNRYLSRTLTPNLDDVLVHEGTILVSRSGTIGNVAICTKDFEGFAVSEHAIRVDVKDDIDRGLIYALLLSELGQFLVTRNKSGSVVVQLYEADIEKVPLPLLPKPIRQELSTLMRRASGLRAAANDLLSEAEFGVSEDCGLPAIDRFAPSGFKEVGSGIAFSVSGRERFRSDAEFGQLRFDATFHEPTALALSKHILKRNDGTFLGKVISAIRNSTLRKRVYVDDPEDGVPLLGGKQLTQWRPTELKYLSKAMTRNLTSEVVERGWTLVSCGGTLGRTTFVHRNLEAVAVSQDVMRVLPDPAGLYAGFVYAFLSSPYGQIQLMQRGYGSVIPRLRDFQFNSIAIVVPPDKGERIHDLVVDAYDRRADAKVLEDEAVQLFMNAIERGQAATEATWGREY